METILLQKIRDLIEKLPVDNTLITEILTKLTELAANLEDVPQIANDVASITEDVLNIATESETTNTNLEEIMHNTSNTNDNVNTFHTDVENILTPMSIDVDSIRNNCILIESKIDTLVNDGKTSLSNQDIIKNFMQPIADNIAKSASFNEAIATNTQNSYQKLVAISADTTEITALLRRIIDKLEGGSTI